ncbi:hypothetical protein F5146DRAFT_1005401 [Armillaria mellea]|nr:hypothetical protein F5146DRAFT_1005401 [Armillaria mellea]
MVVENTQKKTSAPSTCGPRIEADGPEKNSTPVLNAASQDERYSGRLAMHALTTLYTGFHQQNASCANRTQNDILRVVFYPNVTAKPVPAGVPPARTSRTQYHFFVYRMTTVQEPEHPVLVSKDLNAQMTNRAIRRPGLILNSPVVDALNNVASRPFVSFTLGSHISRSKFLGSGETSFGTIGNPDIEAIRSKCTPPSFGKGEQTVTDPTRSHRILMVRSIEETVKGVSDAKKIEFEWLGPVPAMMFELGPQDAPNCY